MESYRIDNLFEEMVHEILLRLSVKTLLVCKCVCKGWCALIKSPSFVNQHFNLKSNQLECLVAYGVDVSDDEDGEQVTQDAVYMYDDESRSLIEAPNHLLQIPAYMVAEGLELEKGIVCLRLSSLLGLFNPATRELKKLPPIPELHRQGINDCLWIGCWLDPSSGDFKVVAFKQGKECNYASVYNLSSESWKTVETIDPYDKIGYSADCNGIPTLNGVKHWLVKCADSNIYSLIAFDMRSEKFKKIAIPDALGKTEKSLKITTYCDLVAVFSYKCNESVDLWVMGRDGLWTKKFSIGPYEDVSPYLVWKKKEVLTLQEEYLTMCDVSTKEARTLETMDRVTFIDGCFIYKESLVSINGERVDCLKDVLWLWVKSSRSERRG